MSSLLKIKPVSYHKANHSQNTYSDRVIFYLRYVLVLVVIIELALQRLENKDWYSLSESEDGEGIALAWKFEAQHLEAMRVDNSILEPPEEQGDEGQPVKLHLDYYPHLQAEKKYHNEYIEPAGRLWARTVDNLTHNEPWDTLAKPEKHEGKEAIGQELSLRFLWVLNLLLSCHYRCKKTRPVSDGSARPDYLGEEDSHFLGDEQL